jgi:hypothetical protein
LPVCGTRPLCHTGISAQSSSSVFTRIILHKTTCCAFVISTHKPCRPVSPIPTFYLFCFLHIPRT